MEEDKKYEDLDINIDLEALKKFRNYELKKIIEKKEELAKATEELVEFSKDNNAFQNDGKWIKSSIKSIRIENEIEQLYTKLDELIEFTEDYPKLEEQINELENKKDLTDEEIQELFTIKTEFNSIEDTINDEPYRDDYIQMLKDEAKLQKEENEEEISTDQVEKENENLSEITEEQLSKFSDEDIEKLIKNIDLEYDEFIERNNKIFDENNKQIELLYSEFSGSLDDRTDKIEEDLEKIQEIVNDGADSIEILEKEKKLKNQLNDIESDQKLLEEYLDNKEKLDENIKKTRNIVKENRKIKKEIKKLKEYINDPENAKNVDELKQKKSELRKLYKDRKQNFKDLNDIKEDNEELMKSMENIGDSFKTVDFDLTNSDKEIASEEEKIKNDVAAESKEVKIKNNEVVKEQEIESPITQQTQEQNTQTQQNPATQSNSTNEQEAETIDEQDENTQQNVEEDNLKNLPSLSYQEIINKYISEPTGSKTNNFLRNNFPSIMVSLDDALKNGKVSSSQKKELKMALQNHKHEIDHNMKMFNSSALCNIFTNLFKDDEERLNEYTYLDKETNTRKLNDGIFASIYKKEKIGEDEYKCDLRDISEMDEEAHNFISVLFIKYDHMVKDGTINENSELFKQFNKYVSDPVKYQMLVKSGNRVCKNKILQKIKSIFSRKDKEDKSDYLKDFIVKVDKSREVKATENKKLDLSEQVEQNPPIIDEEEKQKQAPVQDEEEI